MISFMRPKNTTRQARTSDRKYIRALAKKFSEQLGFLPDEAIRNRIDQGCVQICIENGEPAGYLLHAPELASAPHILPIFQAAVQLDAQRRQHGFALVEELQLLAHEQAQTIIQCKCRQELEANAFWEAMGFIAVAIEDTAAVRGQPKIIWRKPIVRMTAATLLEMPDNPRNQTGGGRSVGRHDYARLPMLTIMSPAEIIERLKALDPAA